MGGSPSKDTKPKSLYGLIGIILKTCQLLISRKNMKFSNFYPVVSKVKSKVFLHSVTMELLLFKCPETRGLSNMSAAFSSVKFHSVEY